MLSSLCAAASGLPLPPDMTWDPAFACLFKTLQTVTPATAHPMYWPGLPCFAAQQRFQNLVRGLESEVLALARKLQAYEQQLAALGVPMPGPYGSSGSGGLGQLAGLGELECLPQGGLGGGLLVCMYTLLQGLCIVPDLAVQLFAPVRVSHTSHCPKVGNES